MRSTDYRPYKYQDNQSKSDAVCNSPKKGSTKISFAAFMQVDRNTGKLSLGTNEKSLSVRSPFNYFIFYWYRTLNPVVFSFYLGGGWGPSFVSLKSLIKVNNLGTRLYNFIYRNLWWTRCLWFLYLESYGDLLNHLQNQDDRKTFSIIF